MADGHGEGFGQSRMDEKANIVAWDWKEFAFDPRHPDPITTSSLTPSQGEALGAVLYAALGMGYAKPIHFIGHSLGTLVNASAANYLHGDAPRSNPPGRWISTRTHMTMLDEAQKASGGFVRVVPNRAAWIDNYYSWSGGWKSAAVNISLRQGPFRYVVDVQRMKSLVSRERPHALTDCSAKVSFLA